ncbi:MAG: hypothetical protein B6242_11650 [Anaerolineaceae bacterium 4572_78]|nr:MAG: hypothetical protein B6242_11650 [Anaerolineaceae bacterium 4572_78]
MTQLSIKRLFPLIIWDSAGILFSFLTALLFRFDGNVPDEFVASFIKLIPLVIFLYCAINISFGLYSRFWRYANSQEIIIIFISSIISTALFLSFVFFVGNPVRPMPLSVVALGGILTSGVFIILRYRQRILTGLLGRLEKIFGAPDRQRVLIVGAGESGQLLAWQIQSHRQHYDYELVGFVDDNVEKLGLSVRGAPVLGNRHDIPKIVKERSVSLIVIAIHRISGKEFREILSICLGTLSLVKILPDFLKDMNTLNGVLPLKDITPRDLLGRQQHEVDEEACRGLITNKVVLVTGAAGSIGSELCRQILKLKPKQLLLLDNNESGVHDLFITINRQQDISETSLVNIVPIVADITNHARINHIFMEYNPNIVFHAAAYKHVPLMEQHPSEAIRVNILGTHVLDTLSASHSVERFVLISTDKAVKPHSVMGATKRVCEMIIADNMQFSESHAEGYNGHKSNGHYKNNDSPRTLFTAVRFGNVLGSRGSVVPTFAQQIDMGGPVSITHPDMTRYFMSIPEAVRLVIQAASLTHGNDIFMLDMGQEIRIEDLAHKMIRLRGLRPGKDIEIIHTGIRPGEKLREELLGDDEEKISTSHPKIFRIQNNGYQFGSDVLLERISCLDNIVNTNDNNEILQILWDLVGVGSLQKIKGSDFNHAKDKSFAPITSK